MHVKIVRSPDRKKKFRAILGDGRTVDFGASGYSDYTKHKNPSRMRSYVLRHGGQIPKRIVAERQPAMIHRMMRNIDKSDKEDWKLSGYWGCRVLVALVSLESTNDSRGTKVYGKEIWN